MVLMSARNHASAAVTATSWRGVQKEHANLMESGLTAILHADVCSDAITCALHVATIVLVLLVYTLYATSQS